MVIRIASAALDVMRGHVRETGAEEACGLLLGAVRDGRGAVARAVPAANVAEDRVRRFEVDPATLLKVHREAREGGDALVGCYHSHPGGKAMPSLRDAARADQPGWVWLILAGEEMGAFLVTRGGTIAGRFEPIVWEAA